MGVEKIALLPIHLLKESFRRAPIPMALATLVVIGSCSNSSERSKAEDIRSEKRELDQACVYHVDTLRTLGEVATAVNPDPDNYFHAMTLPQRIAEKSGLPARTDSDEPLVPGQPLTLTAAECYTAPATMPVKWNIPPQEIAATIKHLQTTAREEFHDRHDGCDYTSKTPQSLARIIKSAGNTGPVTSQVSIIVRDNALLSPNPRQTISAGQTLALRQRFCGQAIHNGMPITYPTPTASHRSR